MSAVPPSVIVAVACPELPAPSPPVPTRVEAFTVLLVVVVTDRLPIFPTGLPRLAPSATAAVTLAVTLAEVSTAPIATSPPWYPSP